MSSISKLPSLPFIERHLGANEADIQTMLDAMQVSSIDQLLDESLPNRLRRSSNMSLPEPVHEVPAQEELAQYAEQLPGSHSMVGDGFYPTALPPVVQRNILENPAWYTAYTPYQAEISQGRLTMLLHFQQLICDLTGLTIANASLLDEASAAAEAMMFTLRIRPKAPRRFFVHRSVPSRIRAVLETRAELVNIELVSDLSNPVAGGLVSFPTADPDEAALSQLVADEQALAIAHVDPLALPLMQAPGDLGYDVAIGSMQRFGLPMGAGGPHAAFFAAHIQHARMLPGRVIAVSRDSNGSPALRMALQSREQHIRRARATSNICTAQVLPAILATSWALYHHAEGIQRIALHVAALAALIEEALSSAGLTVVSCGLPWEVLVQGEDLSSLQAVAQSKGIDLGLRDDCLVIAPAETTEFSHISKLLQAFGISLSEEAIADAYQRHGEKIRSFYARDVELNAAIPHLKSETDALRYFRRLADMDLALDRTSIPLGSCTMKLNATSQMQPVTWDAVGGVHPLRLEGTVFPTVVADLERWLAEICDLDAVALQPNAGSQGELSGLCAIRNYHLSRGDDERNLCLVPESAHGTNPSSAVLAGFEVVTVKSTEDGTVSLEQLEQLLEKHGPRVAALMLTYPSTAGVFEEGVIDITSAIHKVGGQVYLDGANMNAMMGLVSLRDLGVDVAHLNLHKTFCIPHGGGGPGVGAVASAAHLNAFLPGYRAGNPESNPISVANAPLGNAGVLPITWMYIRTTGSEGLTQCSKNAIVAANYVAARLAGHYRVRYSSKAGRVAHECTIDVRTFRKVGVTEEDIAKRLVDYGFHAPTISFPHAGTLMIEPTECESLREIDRFIEAMIGIRREIERVESGEWEKEDNPLVNAPHTANTLVGEWAHAYTRRTAVYPLAALEETGNKYWPPVSRVDAVWGDRNLQPCWTSD